MGYIYDQKLAILQYLSIEKICEIRRIGVYLVENTEDKFCRTYFNFYVLEGRHSSV